MPTTLIEEDLVTALSGLTVYPLSLPSKGEAVFPCVVYQQISDKQFKSHSGNTLRRIRYQLRCLGTTYTTCLAVANTVKGNLDLNKINFKFASKQNELSIKEVESGLFSTVLDFFIWTSK